MEICRGSFTRRLSARQAFRMECGVQELRDLLLESNEINCAVRHAAMKLWSHELHFTSFNQPPEFSLETLLLKRIFHTHMTSWVESCESFSHAGHVVHTCNTEKVGCLRIRDLSALESSSTGTLCRLPRHKSLWSIGKLETIAVFCLVQKRQTPHLLQNFVLHEIKDDFVSRNGSLSLFLSWDHWYLPPFSWLPSLTQLRLLQIFRHPRLLLGP